MVKWLKLAHAEQEDLGSDLCKCYFSPVVLVGRENAENLPVKNLLVSVHTDRNKINLAVIPGPMTGLNKHILWSKNLLQKTWQNMKA